MKSRAKRRIICERESEEERNEREGIWRDKHDHVEWEIRKTTKTGEASVKGADKKRKVQISNHRCRNKERFAECLHWQGRIEEQKKEKRSIDER